MLAQKENKLHGVYVTFRKILIVFLLGPVEDRIKFEV